MKIGIICLEKDTQTKRALEEYMKGDVEIIELVKISINGSSDARVKAMHKVDIILDDDYRSGVNNRIKGATVQASVSDYEKLLSLNSIAPDRFLFGGQSGGTIFDKHSKVLVPRAMQIFTKYHNNGNWDTSFFGRLNDDVNFSIRNWKTGVASFGLNFFRSSAQQAEYSDNSNAYSNDNGFEKSYSSVLRSPIAASLINGIQTKYSKTTRIHHFVQWQKIMPKIVIKKGA